MRTICKVTKGVTDATLVMLPTVFESSPIKKSVNATKMTRIFVKESLQPTGTIQESQRVDENIDV